MADPKLDPRLAELVAREVAEGNAIENRGEAQDGRVAVRLARPFSEEYRITLGEDGIHYRRDEMHDPRASYEYDDEILETARSLVSAPTPESAAFRERRARAQVRELPKDRWLKDGPPPLHDLLAQIADSIERELRRLGVWIQDPPKEVPKFHRAFGGDVMPFTDWIQLVMIPRLREIAATKAPMPGPGVAAYAVRELDGQDEFATLLARLGALDRMAGSLHGPSYTRRDARHLSAGVVIIVLAILLGLAGVWLASLVNAAVDRRSSDQVVVPFEVGGFASAAIHSVEARVEGAIAGEDAIEPRIFSFVTARSSSMRIGSRPLDVESTGEKDVAAIASWLEGHGAARGDAKTELDVRRLANIAGAALATRSLGTLKAGIDSEGMTLRAVNESFRYHGRAPDSTHNAILIAILLALLVPVPFLAMWLRRRFVLNS